MNVGPDEDNCHALLLYKVTNLVIAIASLTNLVAICTLKFSNFFDLSILLQYFLSEHRAVSTYFYFVY